MRSSTVLFWLPRALALAAAAVLSLFALDVFSEHQGIAEIAGALAVHLIPSAVVLLALAVAWRREWLGGLLFLALGAAYAAATTSRPDWVVVVAGPLWLIGALFLLAHASRTRRDGASQRA